MIQSPAHQALAEQGRRQLTSCCSRTTTSPAPSHAAAAGRPGQAQQRRHRRQPGRTRSPSATTPATRAAGRRRPGHHRRGQGGQPGRHGRLRRLRHLDHGDRARRPARRRPRRPSRPPTWSIVFVGTDLNVATEGKDRASLAMPGNYDSLISQVAALGNPRMALVDPVRRPGRHRQTCRATSRPSSSAATTARARAPRWPRCCSARQNPAGHLDFTWYADDSQLPADARTTGSPRPRPAGSAAPTCTSPARPTYPFGYGLSYSHVQVLRRHGRRRVRPRPTAPCTSAST